MKKISEEGWTRLTAVVDILRYTLRAVRFIIFSELVCFAWLASRELSGFTTLVAGLADRIARLFLFETNSERFFVLVKTLFLVGLSIALYILAVRLLRCLIFFHYNKGLASQFNNPPVVAFVRLHKGRRHMFEWHLITNMTDIEMQSHVDKLKRALGIIHYGGVTYGRFKKIVVRGIPTIFSDNIDDVIKRSLENQSRH